MKKLKDSVFKNLKYSNDFLFERREKERLLTEYSKTKNNFNITTTHVSKNNSQLPYIETYYTITTSPSTQKAYSTARNKKTKKLIKTNTDFYNTTFNNNINSELKNFNQTNFQFYKRNNQNNNSESNNNLYITESKTERKSFSKVLRKYILEENDEKQNFIKLLKEFDVNNTANNSREKKIKSLIKYKKDSIKRKKDQIEKYINQTRELKLLKYTMDIKKESSISFKEMNKNEIEKIEDVIKSMKSANKLFNDSFFIKFNDYVKELEIQREIQKTENINLIRQIIKKKIENSQIESKIRKVELEKDLILRWIFFQISIKENKINLPSYYKSLIEDTDENINKIFDNPSNFLEEKTTEKTVKLYKRQSTRKKFERRQSMRKSLGDKNLIQTLKSISNISIDLYKNITIEEAKRIREYKYNLCYETPYDFMDALKKFEYSLINYLDKYNKIKNQIQTLKTEKMNFEKQLIADNKIILEHIKECENALNIQKNKNILLKKEIEDVKVTMINNFKKENKNNKEGRLNVFNNSDSLKEKSKPNLYNTILILYNSCSQIPLSEVLNIEHLNIKKIYTKEEEMMDMLSKIELVIDYLIFKHRNYKNKNGIYYDLYKRIQSDIEHKRKLEKNKRQRQEENDRIFKLLKKIEFRDNKVYFLPRKKIEIYEIDFQKKKFKFKNNDDFKNPELKDFLYNNGE